MHSDTEAVLKAVAPLTKKRNGGRVREAPRIDKPVSFEHLFKVYRHASKKLRAMLLIHARTGMRPNELAIMRPCDVDTSGENGIWIYRPQFHKTDRKRTKEDARNVYIGPKAQRVLKPWLEAVQNPEATVFGLKRNSYSGAIRRVCIEIGIPVFGANRLRHFYATRMRRLGREDAAQVQLGHSSMAMTAHYSKHQTEKAQEAALALG